MLGLSQWPKETPQKQSPSLKIQSYRGNSFKNVEFWRNEMCFRKSSYFTFFFFVGILHTHRWIQETINTILLNSRSAEIASDSEWKFCEPFGTKCQQLNQSQSSVRWQHKAVYQSGPPFGLRQQNCIICRNLSLEDWHLLTGLQIGFIYNRGGVGHSKKIYVHGLRTSSDVAGRSCMIMLTQLFVTRYETWQ